MKSVRKSILPWAAPFLLVTLAGCGGSKIVKVSGTLTYKGQAVKNAYVSFTPENGRPSWGETDDQGHFDLHFDRKEDGAVTGKHKVSVRPKENTAAEREPGKAPPVSPEMRAFFNKYSGENSKVEVVIDKPTSDLKLDWN
jgi:hypothetical protein